MLGIPALLAFSGALKGLRLKSAVVIDAFFLIWLILLIFRKETVGVDLRNYHYLFIRSFYVSLDESLLHAFHPDYEIGVTLLSKLIGVFTSDFRVFIVVTALLSILPIWMMYRVNADTNPYLSIVVLLAVGLFSIYFSAIRQVLAMGFVYPAFEAVKRKKLRPFLLCVLLAYFFHHSALVMLLMYPVYHMKLKRQTDMLLILPLILLVYVFRVPVFNFLRVVIGTYYAGSTKETGAFLALALLAIFLLYSYLIPDSGKLDEQTVGLRNLLILTVVIQIFSGINYVAMRMNYYFLLLVPLLLPRIAARASERNRKMAKTSVVVMVLFFTFWYYYRAYTTADILRVYPYIPAWAI